MPELLKELFENKIKKNYPRCKRNDKFFKWAIGMRLVQDESAHIVVTGFGLNTHKANM